MRFRRKFVNSSVNPLPTFIKAVKMFLQELKLQYFPRFHLVVAIDANDQLPKFRINIGDGFVAQMFGKAQPALPGTTLA